MKTRLFIGNLASTVTEADLRDKFEALLSSHKDQVTLGNVEVRCKNEDHYFGYVDVVHVKKEGSWSKDKDAKQSDHNPPPFIRKYIDLMNNTKWKGSLIKVQVAKESFIDKLKREQAQGKTQSRNDQPAKPKGPPTEQSRNQQQADAVLSKMKRPRERLNKSTRLNNHTSESTTVPNENNVAVIRNCGFEVVTGTGTIPPKKDSPKRKKKKAKTDTSSDSSDDDVKGGIPKFRGLLACYPEGFPSQPATNSHTSEVTPATKPTKVEEESSGDVDSRHQRKLVALASQDEIKREPKEPKNKLPTTSSNASSAINFKKSKQQKSDLLRLQSLDKLKDLKTQRQNLIKSSLSSVTTSAPVTEQRKTIISDDEKDEDVEPQEKKQQMKLFDESDSDDESEVDLSNEKEEDEDTFRVKKQFEGARGQKLLELQSRWGNDSRFKIDDRFKDAEKIVEDNEEVDAAKEKEKQFNILTDILGKDMTSISKRDPGKSGKKVSSRGSPSKDTFSSVIMPRYDPEAEEVSDKTESNRISDDEGPALKKTKREKAEVKQQSEEKEKPARSNEPSTFKTVANLKALFSTSDNTTGDTSHKDSSLKENMESTQAPSKSFSLLSTFGKAQSDDSDEDVNTSKADKRSVATKLSSKTTSAAGPRNFWESNPFKYDSSDDEQDVKVKVTTENKNSKSVAPSNLLIHGKSPFFFTANDTRFEGLHDYFLKGDEPTKPVENGDVKGESATGKDAIEDFSQKRQELKSIVKAKIRNARRKDEKRTLAIKRAIRKRKGKQKQKDFLRRIVKKRREV